MRHGVRWGGAAILLVALAVGCTKGPTGDSKEKEEQVQAKFAALQAALKDVLAKPEDADAARHLWDLFHTDTQQDADRVAKGVSAKYAKADDAAKAKLTEVLGVAGAKLDQLSGLDYIRSKVFLNKYHEIPGSKYEKNAFERDKAWAHYVEADGDHEKVEMALQDRQWKIILPIPPLPRIEAK